GERSGAVGVEGGERGGRLADGGSEQQIVLVEPPERSRDPIAVPVARGEQLAPRGLARVEMRELPEKGLDIFRRHPAPQPQGEVLEAAGGTRRAEQRAVQSAMP